MANISIFNLQSINNELEQLSDLDSKVIVGGLIRFDACVEFVPVKTITLPDGSVIVRLKPVFIPCNPQPPELFFS